MAVNSGLIGGIIAGISGLGQNLFGTSWKEEANRKEAALGDAHKFSIPQSQLDYEQLMGSYAGQDMPNYSELVNQARATSDYQAASAGRVASSQFGAMGGANAAQAGRKKYLRQLGIANDAYKSNAEAGAIEAQMGRAPYEQMQFEYNEFLPWQIAKNEIASIRGVGQQQLTSGLDTAAAAGIHATNIYQQNQQYT